MSIERSTLVGSIDHRFRRLSHRPESRESQSPILCRVGLELGAICCGDSLSDEVEHRHADGLGLAWHSFAQAVAGGRGADYVPMLSDVVAAANAV